jgi:hypothetical protein
VHAQLGPDDRQLRKHGVADLALQHRVVAQDTPKDGCGDKQKREEREESVVSDERGEVVAAIIRVLAVDGERERQPGVALLEAIEALDEPHARIVDPAAARANPVKL